MKKRLCAMLLSAVMVLSLLLSGLPVIERVSAAQRVCIDLIELTDIHGAIGTDTDPIAGRLTASIEAVRKSNPNGTVVIGGGDYFTAESTDLSNRYYGVPVQQWLNLIGLDAQIIGNHELEWALRPMCGAAADRSTLLSCNLVGTDGRLLMDKGSRLIEKNGIRLLIVGSMSEMDYSFTYVRKILDPVACTKAEIDRYAQDEYDLIIPVCHGDGLVLNELAALADEGYPIACVFGGHSHDTVARTYDTPGGHAVPICIAPAYSKGFAHLRLTYDAQTKTTEIAEVSKGNNIIDTPTANPAPNDPGYAAFSAAWDIVKLWQAGQGQMPQPCSPAGYDLPTGQSAVPGAPKEGTCGAGLSWALHDGVLSISGSGEMNDYGKTPAPWLCCGETITELRLSDGLQKIGAWAFAGCTELKTITLPNSLRRIGRYAFCGCKQLQSLTVPEGVMAIGSGAFRYCEALTDLMLPDSAVRLGSCLVKNTPFYAEKTANQNVLYVGKHLLEVKPALKGDLLVADGTRSIADGAAADCRDLTGMILPEGLRAIGTWAFYNSKNIKKLSLPDSVSFLGESALYSCGALASAELGSGLSEIGQDAFYCCFALKSVSIRDIGAWCEVLFGNKFSNPAYYSRSLLLNGKPLTEVIVPDGVRRIGQYAFYLCTGLTRVQLPESVKEIGKLAFYNCEALREINLPRCVDRVREGTFQNCYNLKGIVLPQGLKAVEKDAFAACSRLRYVIFTGNPPALDAAAFANAAPNTAACVYYPPSSAWSSASKTAYGGNLIWLPSSGTLSGNVKYTINADAASISVSGSGNMPSISGFQPWIFTALQQFARRITFDRQTTSVSAWSFAGMAEVESVVLPKNISMVSNDAFRECKALKEIYVLNSKCGFGTEKGTLGVPGYTVVYGYSGSTAQTFAKQNGYTFCPIGSCANGAHVYEFTSLTKPTCTQKGDCLYTCAVCGKTKTEDIIPACAHCFENGVCLFCGAGENDPCLGYSDIKRNKWYHAAADFVISRGLMGSTKTDELTFEPNTKVSRAMVASILYRMANSPAVSYKGTFSDVRNGKWFTSAIEWCAQNGLASGKGDGKFDPNGNVTRQELAVFMMKMAQYLGKPTEGRNDLSGFADSASVPKWARDYVKWAVDAGLISGQASSGKTYLAPKDNATRAEFASIIMRFVQNIAEG